MNRTSSSLFTVATLALLAALATSKSAQADWSDNFNGAFQQPWQFGSVTGLGGASGSFTADASSGQLVTSDTNSAAAGGAGVAFGVVVSEQFSDVLVSGTLNPNGDAATAGTLTLLARGNPVAATFYAAEINYTNSELIIFRNDNLTSASNLVSAPIANLTTADSVYVDFRLIGDSLRARAFDAPGGSLLASVSASDSTFAGGFAGVLANANDVTLPLLGVWDNVAASVIPEPASAVMMITALGAALSAGRRRCVR